MWTELEALFGKSMEHLAESLDKAIKTAFENYERLRQTEQKGILSHIYISFLLSGVLCKLPWLRVDLCDEDGRGDIVECYAEWDVSCISDKLYKDAVSRTKQNNRMKDWELEQIWLNAAEEYYNAFEAFMPSIIDKCPASRYICCKWHFGQYLGSAVIVREKNKDEIF